MFSNFILFCKVRKLRKMIENVHLSIQCIIHIINKYCKTEMLLRKKSMLILYLCLKVYFSCI